MADLPLTWEEPARTGGAARRHPRAGVAGGGKIHTSLPVLGRGATTPAPLYFSSLFAQVFRRWGF